MIPLKNQFGLILSINCDPNMQAFIYNNNKSNYAKIV